MTSEEKSSWWSRLKSSFTGLQNVFMGPLRAIFGTGKTLSDELRKNLKRHFIEADFGPELTKELLVLATQASINDPEQVLPQLKSHLKSLLPPKAATWPSSLQCIILVGVNGSGKTTSIAKIAHLYRGCNPILIPADTYRAAAVEQLEAWSLRANIPFFRHELADPSAVTYQGLDYAIKNKQLALIDTSGRLPNNPGLMNELAKTKRVALKKLENARELRTVLVLDASQGQNLIEQVRLFNEALTVDALIITKLDGSSKAGTLFQITQKFKIPIDYCGIGEKLDDLVPFDPDAFLESLWGSQ